MSSTEPKFTLRYWPLPFRGCFISYLFAWRGAPLAMESGMDENIELKGRPPEEQAVPYVGPPVLVENVSGRALSQMPAIVLYVSRELDLLPADDFDAAMCMKVLMDCNDVLMEICRYNGSIMWEREAWQTFRGQRLPRWLDVFEEGARRGHIGGESVSYADIAVYALFGNMSRCLPELAPDVRDRAPRVWALCQAIGAAPTLAAYVADEEARYGKLYCGGQIEESIHKMLAMDEAT